MQAFRERDENVFKITRASPVASMQPLYVKNLCKHCSGGHRRSYRHHMVPFGGEMRTRLTTATVYTISGGRGGGGGAPCSNHKGELVAQNGTLCVLLPMCW